MRTITFYNPMYATIVGTTLILAAMFLAPIHRAEAQSISELQATIDELMEQIEELQSRISEMRNNGIGSCV